jgi:hypothetical protein
VRKKTARKTELNVLWHSTGFPQVCQFFCQFCVSYCACDYGGQKQGRRLLFASHIGHNVIPKEEKKERKMWSKKRYLKRNNHAMLIC